MGGWCYFFVLGFGGVCCDCFRCSCLCFRCNVGWVVVFFVECVFVFSFEYFVLCVFSGLICFGFRFGVWMCFFFM